MMEPRTRKLIIYSLFVAAAAYGLLNLRGRPDKPISGPATGPSESRPSQVIQSSKLIDIEKYSAMTWGRDPFVRDHVEIVDSAKAAAPTWTLGGILYDDLSPAAIINGRVMRTGESIEGAKILKIDRNKVTLENSGGRFSLNLAKDKS